jgi:hypothetical protein
MARTAQGQQVRAVEPLAARADGDDVVDLGRRPAAAMLALRAPDEHRGAYAVPARPIPALPCAGPARLVRALASCALRGPLRRVLWAAVAGGAGSAVTAGAQGTSRHIETVQRMRFPCRDVYYEIRNKVRLGAHARMTIGPRSGGRSCVVFQVIEHRAQT